MDGGDMDEEGVPVMAAPRSAGGLHLPQGFKVEVIADIAARIGRRLHTVPSLAQSLCRAPTGSATLSWIVIIMQTLQSIHRPCITELQLGSASE